MGNGHLNGKQRVAKIWRQMLVDFKGPSMQPSIRNALAEFMVERKIAIPDKWY